MSQDGNRRPNVFGTILKEPPLSLLDGKSLFLDLDGTLLDIIDQPDQVKADAATRGLLERVAEKLDGRLAIVSGRSLIQIDAMLGPIAREIAVSGSHGSEHRWRGVAAHPARPPSLSAVTDSFRAFAAGRPGLLVEEKSFGAVLHYRQAPALAHEARALALALAARHELQVQDGAMMVEVRPPGGDKGTALRRLMERAPMAGTLPVFLGDDVTDEPGFEAALRMGGAAILVGDRRPTAADHSLPDPATVRRWLGEFAA